MEEFKKLGLSEKIIKTLEKKGFTKPTQIQEQAIPLLLEGKVDVLGQSQTGTGKTASFALPIIEKLRTDSRNVQAIILAPTRELAIQVAKEIESLMGQKRLSILTVYGGSSMSDQTRRLKKGVDIVVGTPGRIIDHIKRKNLDLSKVSFAVLDEADEMLNMGFVEDIERILKNTPKNKRMLLFSATMPKSVLSIAKKYMREHVVLHVKKEEVTQSLTEQIYYDINSRERFEGLKRVIDGTPDFYGIIFCKMKSTVDELAQKLLNNKYRAAALHGDISQGQREKILLQFRKKNINILVATDVAARGIDVKELTHVVNYSLPQSPESYVHRIGRTGRAGKKGIAITFVIPSEKGKLRFIERVAKTTLRKEEFPSVQEIIDSKKEHMVEEIEKLLNKKKNSPVFNKIAKEILIKNSPVDVVSSLLQYAFSASLDPSRYKEIKKVTAREFRNERKGGRRSNNDGRRRSSRGKRDSQGRDGERSSFRKGSGRKGHNDRAKRRPVKPFRR